jgi:hypothetical protein
MKEPNSFILTELEPTTTMPSNYDPRRMDGSRKKKRQERRSTARYIVASFILRFSVFVFMMNSILFLVTFHRSKHMRQLNRQPSYKPSIFLLNIQPSAFNNLVPTIVDNETMTLRLFDIYENEQEMIGRSVRFPSVEERLKVYLSTWYVPPCPSNELGTVQYNFVVGDDMTNDKRKTQTKPGLRVLVKPVRSVNATKDWELHSNRKMKKVDFDQKSSSLDILSIDTTVRWDRNLFLYDPEAIVKCNDPFCKDVLNFMNPSLNRILTSTTEGVH